MSSNIFAAVGALLIGTILVEAVIIYAIVIAEAVRDWRKESKCKSR